MVMRSRTSRTTTASPCLEAAARAAREARVRESASAWSVRSLLPGSRFPEILPHDDGDVGDARRLHTYIHFSHLKGSNHLIRLRDERIAPGHDLRGDLLER